MNRTDRLLAIVLELQAKKLLRAEDLAATFEVTKRTIYRDVQALSEAGVPVVSLPRQGYSLIDGYFLPPLAFTSDEAMMLLLGSSFAALDFDAQYRAAAQSASRKIEAVLRDDFRAEVDYLRSNIRFIVSNLSDREDTLQQLRRAILQRRTVRFCYHARFSADKDNTGQLRDADPYALLHVDGIWQLMAYCHLRHDIRQFRLDRMDDFVLLDRTFTRPAHFKLSAMRKDVGKITIRALFDETVARWVHESPSFYQVEEKACDGGLLVTFKVHQEEQIVQWLLGWGAHVQILEPDSLRERLAHESAKMLQVHSKESLLESANLD
ncbi:MAG: YafY family transcriptional regulator [Anaerolineae bacterium]|nr:YafY family transcriptional regulator [Anaerolineae bacterium]